GRARGRLLSAPPSPRPARPPSRRRRRRPPSPHGGGHGTRGRTTGAWPRRSPLTDSVLDRRGLERRLAFLHVHLEAHGPAGVLLNQLVAVLAKLGHKLLVRDPLRGLPAAGAGRHEVLEH